MMKLRVFIHAMFVADSESGQTEFVCEGSRNLAEILSEVTNGERRVISTMLDETGRFRPHVAVFFGNDQQRELITPDVEIDPDVKEISIFPALSGG